MNINKLSFSDVLTDITSKYFKIPKKDFNDKGKYAIIDQSIDYIAGYTNNESKVKSNIGESAVIIFGDHTRIIKYVNFPFAIGADGVKVLSVNPEAADPKYIYYFLKSINIPSAGYSRHFKFLKKKKIILPNSLTDQKRIAKVLSHCEELIQKRKQSIKLLDEFLKSTFLEMFGEENPSYDDWKIDKIENYAFPKKGSMRTGPFGSALLHSEFKEYGEVRVLGIDNVVNDIFEMGNPRFITKDKFQELKRYQVYPGDVLISIMATNGKSAVVPNDIPTSINTKHLAAITPNTQKVLPFYLKYAIQYHPFILKQLRKNMKGAIMSGLNLSIIKKLQLSQPPILIQNKFTEIVHKHQFLKLKYIQSLTELESLYGSLSQKAFKGELDLSGVEVEDRVKGDILPPEVNEYIKEADNILSNYKAPELLHKHVQFLNQRFVHIDKIYKQFEKFPKIPKVVFDRVEAIEKFRSQVPEPAEQN